MWTRHCCRPAGSHSYQLSKVWLLPHLARIQRAEDLILGSNLQPPTGLSRTLYSVPCTCSLYTNARVARSFSRGARWGKNHLCKSAYNLTGGLYPRHRTSLCECDVLLGPVADIVILLMLCNAVQLLLLPATPPIRLSSSSRPFSQDLLAPTHFFSSSELSTATHSSARSVLTGS